ncbi:MAG: dTMP kinase [Pelagibacteraceae bacterium TMED237]|nr:MAG: dTMP kinase [Pelagibacteraceae bacterium TMED237]|tara:strand:+ start:2658 stop:3269 length:612 start_codon:yes stop_codon:yes gene_type:complete
MNINKGIFISFEGPEASGKSSQISLLSKYLKKRRIPYVISREPGGTKLSEKLRKIILNNKSNINNLEEILLLMAARSNHINNFIKPNLIKKKIVISDRFADSTFVYQGFVNNFGISKVKKLHQELLNNFNPDITFIFNLNTNEIIKRLKKRKNKNKYDKINLEFHNRVIEGYKKISTKKRYINIDASLSKLMIHNNILNSLKL